MISLIVIVVLFSVSVCVFLFWSCMCKVVCVRLCVYMITVCLCLHDYIVRKYWNSC